MESKTNFIGFGLHPIGHFWRFSMLLALGLFLLGLVFFIILPNSPVTVEQMGSFGGYITTLLLFWIGGIGVLATSKTILEKKDMPSLRKIGRSHLIFDWIIIFFQAFILNTLVWYVFSDLHTFSLWSLLLAGLDMIWLGVKIRQYDSAFETVRTEYESFKCLPQEIQSTDYKLPMLRNERLASNIKKTQYTMLNWLIINGVYSVLISLMIQMDQLNLCVYLTILRSIADFILCRQYYLDVLTGELVQEAYD